jgi:hypothetical protein
MAGLYDIGAAILGALYAWRIPAAIGAAIVVAVLVVVGRQRGWTGRIRRHPRATAGIVIPLLVLGLPLTWYLASPLVLSATIDEPAPIVAVSANPTQPPPSTATAPPATGSAQPAPSAAATTPSAAPLIARAGTFHGSDEFHFGRGTARLIETSPGAFVVRLEDFAVRNGPDLYVYLSPDANAYAPDAIELGRLKADTGNQNYPVPAGALADPSDAASIVIWCKQFSHLFATAPLAR